MAWKTLYVTGRPGFDQKVLFYLEQYGDYFLTGSFNEEGIYLFWVTEDFILRKFKRKIGSKIVFKYRLRFFFTIDTFTTSREKEKSLHRTPDEEQTFAELNTLKI